MLSITDHDVVRVIQMDHAPVNALGPAMVAKLRGELDMAVAGEARAIVLAGRPGIFSAGLDVPTLLGFDRAAIRSFWREFFWLQHELAASKLPVVAAITGHAPAGGLVTALFCDYRIMADGPFKIGLNEVRVGLVLAPPFVTAFERAVGARTAERLIATGELMMPAEALEVGMIDEVVPPDAVLDLALERALELASLPQLALRMNRAVARQELVASFDAVTDEFLDELATLWFEAETQETLKGLVARLKKR